MFLLKMKPTIYGNSYNIIPKKEPGFDPENYNLKIEALAMADTSFVFTITKEVPEEKAKEKRRGRGIKVLYSKASIDVYEISGYVIRGNL